MSNSTSVSKKNKDPYEPVYKELSEHNIQRICNKVSDEFNDTKITDKKTAIIKVVKEILNETREKVLARNIFDTKVKQEDIDSQFDKFADIFYQKLEQEFKKMQPGMAAKILNSQVFWGALAAGLIVGALALATAGCGLVLAGGATSGFGLAFCAAITAKVTAAAGITLTAKQVAIIGVATLIAAYGVFKGGMIAVHRWAERSETDIGQYYRDKEGLENKTGLKYQQKVEMDKVVVKNVFQEAVNDYKKLIIEAEDKEKAKSSNNSSSKAVNKPEFGKFFAQVLEESMKLYNAEARRIEKLLKPVQQNRQ